MENVNFKNELTFNFNLFEDIIKIIHLGYDKFILIQFGPNEGSSLDINKLDVYSKNDIISIIELLSENSDELDYAINIFNKYLKLLK